ncbi:MAG: E3 binding domain-containing protein, partial [Akkermansiaceae bacterium]|nr:E3 binding domain-containing protein [Verrucomicrobiales bacterium]
MDVKLPNLGEGADSGTVVNLFVKEGDQIAKDQPILELENEKAVATIPSTGAGVVTKVYVKAGDKITVGARLVSVSEDGKAAAPAAAAPQAAAAKAKPAAPKLVEEPEEAEAAEEPESTENVDEINAQIAAAPTVRKVARELGIDLRKVRGSARGGRITMDDLKAYIQRLQRLAVQPKAAPGSAASARPAAESID